MFWLCVCEYTHNFIHCIMSNWSLSAWPLKIGPVGCLDTSVLNYNFTLCNIPEERRSHLHRGGSLKSRQQEDRLMCVAWIGYERCVAWIGYERRVAWIGYERCVTWIGYERCVAWIGYERCMTWIGYERCVTWIGYERCGYERCVAWIGYEGESGRTVGYADSWS